MFQRLLKNFFLLFDYITEFCLLLDWLFLKHSNANLLVLGDEQHLFLRQMNVHHLIFLYHLVVEKFFLFYLLNLSLVFFHLILLVLSNFIIIILLINNIQLPSLVPLSFTFFLLIVFFLLMMIQNVLNALLTITENRFIFIKKNNYVILKKKFLMVIMEGITMNFYPALKTVSNALIGQHALNVKRITP